MPTIPAVKVYEIWVATAQACAQCAQYDGKVYGRGVGPKPPLHPNCHCVRMTYNVVHEQPAQQAQAKAKSKAKAKGR